MKKLMTGFMVILSAVTIGTEAFAQVEECPTDELYHSPQKILSSGQKRLQELETLKDTDGGLLWDLFGSDLFNDNLREYSTLLFKGVEPSTYAVDRFQVGYTCQVTTVPTRPKSRFGYKPITDVQWTIVKIEDGQKIWAVHKGDWGPIIVGYREYSTTKESAIKSCNRIVEVNFKGQKIKVLFTLPYSGYGDTDINDPLNFEMLEYLNYKSVVSSYRGGGWREMDSHRCVGVGGNIDR